MAETKKQEPRLEVLDGLRGLAIALVVLFHFWQKSWWNPLERLELLEPLAPCGYLGVELFFFLSGFCLYWPLARSGVAPRWRQYFARRAFKILPSYGLCLLGAWFLIPDETARAHPLLHLVTHLSFTHPFFFETYGLIHGVFWSLGVEVEFYLIFPLVAWLFRKSAIVGALVLVALACLYRLWVFRTFQLTDEGLAYTGRMNQLPGFLDLFGGGVVAAVLVVVAQRRCKPHLAWGLALLAGLAAQLWIFHSFAGHDDGRNAQINYQGLVRLPFALALLVTTVGGADAAAVPAPATLFGGCLLQSLPLAHAGGDTLAESHGNHRAVEHHRSGTADALHAGGLAGLAGCLSTPDLRLRATDPAAWEKAPVGVKATRPCACAGGRGGCARSRGTWRRCGGQGESPARLESARSRRRSRGYWGFPLQ